ncbi:class I SAM-dependent methyltransferase [Streptomyces endophyticus]|uniref:Class I SAM-dependent methyltransferase n=1 Tax=Streptomyces endophyticus TaxID=714166 RepID=A0ABU6FEV3_9ACTN|nr:class I SAM-dependent methyltransferase [Streptomyces endophyticus]MEB8342562.1 class I SAM-dependent methyltransferase [Streptomyces endophyticus]
MHRTAPSHLTDYWDRYKPQHLHEGPPPEVDAFEWTQYPGHGPGAELLGSPATALELGCAEGREAVVLARSGVHVTALDFAPAQVSRARRWWKQVPGLEVREAEACSYLAYTRTQFDAIYSVWGAVWFTDPEQLLPLVVGRLRPGGVFAFSQAEPVAEYGPQPMRGKWLEGGDSELTVLRWQYTPESWADLLKRHGFTHIDAKVLPAPEPDRLGTLIVRAERPAGLPHP